MKTLSILGALTFLSLPAYAREFATPGVLEVGGTFGLSNGSTTEKPKGGSSTTTKSSDLSVRPQFGFFAAKRVEILGGLVLGSRSIDDESSKFTSSTIGIRAGAGYLVSMGVAHIGPQLQLGYDSTQGKDGSTKSTLAGPVVDVGFVAKVPFAAGGIFQVGLGANMAPQKYKIGSNDAVDYTTTSYGISTGFSAYF